jgi:hypothetical protein
MGRGKRQGRSTGTGAPPTGGALTCAADLQLQPGFQALEPALPVRWCVAKQQVEAWAIAASDDTVLMVTAAEPPRPGNQAVFCNVGVPSTVYWGHKTNVSGLTVEAPDLAAGYRQAAVEATKVPRSAYAFAVRKVRMNDQIKMLCAGELSAATGMSADEFAAHLTGPLCRDLVEGGYIRPDGRFSERGIKAAIGAFGEHTVQRQLDLLAARAS